MRRYAEGTEVPAERSRAELETLLRKHGAKEFSVYTSDELTVFTYRIDGRMIRHSIVAPQPSEFRTKTRTRPDHLESAAAAELRRRWRALVLVCKAKLEIVASGGSTFEREFMADLLLPNGETLEVAMRPKIDQMYETGKMPRTLLALGSGQ